MDIESVLYELRRIGCQLFVGADGAVHGRMRPGLKMPIDSRPLVDELRLRNEEAVRAMAAEVKETLEPGADLERWKRMLDAGEIVLAGPVQLDKETGVATLIYRRRC